MKPVPFTQPVAMLNGRRMMMNFSTSFVIVGRGLKRGLRKVNWEVCEQLVTDKIFFYHKFYWGKYETLYTHMTPPNAVTSLPLWADLKTA
jgi:hypothetical protein